MVDKLHHESAPTKVAESGRLRAYNSPRLTVRYCHAFDVASCA